MIHDPYKNKAKEHSIEESTKEKKQYIGPNLRSQKPPILIRQLSMYPLCTFQTELMAGEVYTWVVFNKVLSLMHVSFRIKPFTYWKEVTEEATQLDCFLYQRTRFSGVS